jgi:nucleoid-associated protein YgaU
MRLQALAGNTATTRLIENTPLPGRSSVTAFGGLASLQRAPTATEAPAPAATAAAGAAPTQSVEVAFVREDGLRLHVGADTESGVAAGLPFGTRLHVVEGESLHPTWLKVVTVRGTGFVAANRVLTAPPALLQKDPGVSLVRVRSGQTFWGLVRERYGIRGNEGSADQNVNHFINAIRAVNDPSAFSVKTDALDDLGNVIVPGRDASDTLLKENADLWIPSFAVAAAMDVGSGTVSGEIARLVKAVEQKIADFRAAARAAGGYVPGAVARHAGEVGAGLIEGLVAFAIEAAEVLAVSTAAGALIGSLFGGVGAIPGAEIGFEIGLMVLELYGLAMLIELVLSMAGSLVSLLGQFIAQVWDANGDPKKIDAAGKTLAEALGTLVSAVLLALVMYVTHRGAKALTSTRFAQKVGQTRIAQWLADRQKAKTATELGRPDGPATGRPEARPGEPVTKTSETQGAVTNLGSRSTEANKAIFDRIVDGEGMSGAYDHQTGQFVLRHSTDVKPTPPGSVEVFGGHALVLDDLGAALGEDLSRAARGRVSGFVIIKQPGGTLEFRWNSGQINPGSHGTRAVPDRLRPEIEGAVRRALGQ